MISEPPKMQQVVSRAKLLQKLSSQDILEDIKRNHDKENQNKEKAAVLIQSCMYLKILSEFKC